LGCSKKGKGKWHWCYREIVKKKRKREPEKRIPVSTNKPMVVPVVRRYVSKAEKHRCREVLPIPDYFEARWGVLQQQSGLK